MYLHVPFGKLTQTEKALQAQCTDAEKHYVSRQRNEKGWERESEEGGQRYQLPVIREVRAVDGMKTANTAVQYI